ncbi:MAG: phenylacetate--CoA ligase, partial [Alphaproteobacteria bacterium]
QIEEIVLKEKRLAPHYLLEVRREGALDELDVVVEMAAALAGAGEGAQAACAEELKGRVKDLIGVTARVRLLEPGGVERSMGKAQRVVDLRPKG